MVHVEGVVTHIQRPQEGPGLLHALQSILHQQLQGALGQLGQARVKAAQALDAGRALKEALQVVIHGHLGKSRRRELELSLLAAWTFGYFRFCSLGKGLVFCHQRECT